ncbi:MAG TPA: DUF1905 domain-containing protein [Bacteroidales bacterium]|nr:DUF1905 domain-containing protein [Bacteroidales bacterium]
MIRFSAEIYKVDVNWCVDVPDEITARMPKEKGYIRIKGKINGFDFRKSLVPVKGAPYRLFVNLIMMKGGKTAVGSVAHFEIEQDTEIVKKQEYPMHPVLADYLQQNGLEENFNLLTPARKRDILSYLHRLKNEEVLLRNTNDVIVQLKRGIRDVRIPVNRKKFDF